MTETTRLEDAPTGVGVLVIPSYRLALWWARKQAATPARAGAGSGATASREAADSAPAGRA